MIDFLSNINPIFLSLLATLFTFLITSLGSALVFLFKNIKKDIMDICLSLSAGIMLAASYFSLINPSIELSNKLNISLIFVFIGFILGGLLILFGNKIYKKNTKVSNLIFSITLHNIPEGLAIGVAFGSILYSLEGSNLSSALILALGIGIQNFPEGSAISLPLRREGLSRKKSFLIGSLTGIVEPISGVLGCILALQVRYVLPFLLSFAAGAMIYVVIIELIPESQTNKRKDLMAVFSILGFTIMMILDVTLG